MPGSTPPISQLDWLISTTAMIVLSWSRATRDLLKSFGWGIRALHQLGCSDDGAISSSPAPYHLRAGNHRYLSQRMGPGGTVESFCRSLPGAGPMLGCSGAIRARGTASNAPPIFPVEPASRLSPRRSKLFAAALA